MENLKLYTKQSGLLWLAGFKEACCLHRVVRLCISSRMLSIRTGQCFLLNGFIFLGSLLMLKSVVIPVLLWILPSQCEHLCGSGAATALYSILRFIFIELFYIFWFYPLYVFSIVLSSIWYNDIAKHAFDAVKRLELSMTQAHIANDLSDSQRVTHGGRTGGFERVMLGIGEQVYSILLLTIFFIEVQWSF